MNFIIVLLSSHPYAHIYHVTVTIVKYENRLDFFFLKRLTRRKTTDRLMRAGMRFFTKRRFIIVRDTTISFQTCTDVMLRARRLNFQNAFGNGPAKNSRERRYGNVGQYAQHASEKVGFTTRRIYFPTHKRRIRRPARLHANENTYYISFYIFLPSTKIQ